MIPSDLGPVGSVQPHGKATSVLVMSPFFLLPAHERPPPSASCCYSMYPQHLCTEYPPLQATPHLRPPARNRNGGGARKGAPFFAVDRLVEAQNACSAPQDGSPEANILSRAAPRLRLGARSGHSSSGQQGPSWTLLSHINCPPAEQGKTPPSRQTAQCVMAAEKAAMVPSTSPIAYCSYSYYTSPHLVLLQLALLHLPYPTLSRLPTCTAHPPPPTLQQRTSPIPGPR
ncbi:hypothetical protein CC78DRAFT_586823 [Lojkania enalia]|uniref:Uncharacterized protein n=1 Tax=Lojkania enalia TaxID=147567 RepID=A0A9P4MXW8_9PLEO|nr:hypothetical protein CC78DRAFT_586823 [Didymosphaeria enalia]